MEVTFGTRSSGGCDSSVCRYAESLARGAVLESSSSVSEDGGLVYFLVRDFHLSSVSDVTIRALNQDVAISVLDAFSFTANIVNVTARLSPFLRTGPSVTLELSSPFAFGIGSP